MLPQRSRTTALPTIWPCGRCGIETSLIYCRDCASVDPAFCADQQTKTEIADARREHNTYAKGFWNDILRVSGNGYRSPEQLAQRRERERERTQQRRAARQS